MKRFLCLLLFLATTAACGGTTASLAPESINFAPALQVDLASMQRTSTGVYYRDITEGEGPLVRRGSKVRVHYTGFLPDGTRFEQVVPPAVPIEFTVGDRTVIPGWQSGIMGMRAGGERQMVIPASQAYGSRQVGRVPPHSTLVFVVKLVTSR
jgi:FKBP-type peptidyl-prolyl cis-trans isomerase FkpA